MQTQRKGLNFEGENIYVGIDVHLKSWTVSIMTKELEHKTFTQPASVSSLVGYLERQFPGASYHSVYEAGFSGFWAHRQLNSMGVANIVINPADVPTSQKEHLRKSDAVDSRKLARSLRSGELTAIHVPDPTNMRDRSIVRVRGCIVKDLCRAKQRVKSMLYFYGVPYPAQFDKSSSHWSKRFISWLREVCANQVNGIASVPLSFLISEVETRRQSLLEVTREIRVLSRSNNYIDKMKLLQSVPGVALIAGMMFLTEVGDIKRFRKTDHLAGFIGLIPNCHSSGEKENTGEITHRGKSHLRRAIIESAWVAARTDPALHLSYLKACNRMEPNKAIIKIARKLLNRIYYVLKNEKEYVTSVVK